MTVQFSAVRSLYPKAEPTRSDVNEALDKLEIMEARIGVVRCECGKTLSIMLHLMKSLEVHMGELSLREKSDLFHELEDQYIGLKIVLQNMEKCKAKIELQEWSQDANSMRAAVEKLETAARIQTSKASDLIRQCMSEGEFADEVASEGQAKRRPPAVDTRAPRKSLKFA